MRIAFDGSTLTADKTGVGFYTENLLLSLAGELAEDLVVISHRDIVTSRPIPANLRTLIRGRACPRTLWMQFLAPNMLLALDPGVAHFTNSITPIRKITPYVLTIHDMTLRLFPEMHPWHRVLFRPLTELAARRADAIITVSESSRADTERLLGIPGDKIHVIYNGAAPSFRVMEAGPSFDEIRRRYGLAGRFVLTVGTIEPRKNLKRLIEAFLRLRHGGTLEHQLVCVGRLGWRFKEIPRLIKERNLEGQVVLTGYVPSADLPILYNLCEFFVYPSLYEGFGLPVVEAMACGAPVVVANCPALVEVTGEAAERVNPHNTDSIESALRRLIDSEDLRCELSQRSQVQARRFSWSKAAEETMGIYRTISGNC